VRHALSRFPTSTLMGLAFTVTAMLIAGLLLVYHMMAAEQFLAEEGIRYGEILSDQLLSASQRFLRLGSVAAVQEMIEDTGSKRSVVHVALIDNDGRVVASNRRDWIGQHETIIPDAAYRKAAEAARATFQAQHRLIEDGKRILLVSPLLMQGSSPLLLDSRGVLYMKVDQEAKLKEVYSTILKRGLVSALGILLVSVLLLFWVRTVLARPILGVASFLRDFAAGVDREPPPRAGPREVAQLIEDVERMVRDLRAKQAALLASEERHRRLLEGAYDAIVTVDPDSGRILEVNEMFCRLFGYNREEAKHMPLLNLHAEEDRERLMEAYRGAAELAYRDFHDIPCLRKDGEMIRLDIRGGPIAVGNHTITEWILRDTTQRRRLEEQLRQAQKMESVGTLAGGMAHDFNNLLTGILGYTRLVRLRLAPGDPNHKPLETIERSSLRAAELTAQLQTFSRRAASRPKPANLNDIIAATLERLRVELAPNLNLVVRPGSELWTAALDAPQIQQVLAHLCRNAADAMAEGGRLTVSTANRTLGEDDCRDTLEARPGRFVVLSVEDTGRGIDETIRPRIFEPFFTTKIVGEGTGLGLAMVYGAVKSHDGWIEVQSERGRGARFIVYLPVYDPARDVGRLDPPEAILARLAGAAAAAGGPETNAAAPIAPRAAPARQRTVLAVDDESTVLALARDILELHGYKALTARNGDEALKIYRANPVDLVLLDLTMPVMGGLDCLREILKLDPRARVIVSSGFSAESTVDEVLDEGALDYVQKPYDIDALARIIRRAFDKERPAA
jgi:PAS domain S-box-containing protein